MIEVVFNDSACGSLKIAQHYGRGKYPGGASSVFLCHKDGRAAAKEELEQAKKEFEERERKVWEEATPIGGNSADVFGFNLELSTGDISEDEIGSKRQQELERLYNTYPGENLYVREIMEKARKNLERISERIKSGEPIRVWYSDNPDECCGLYWFMAQLFGKKLKCDSIVTVKLPDMEYDSDKAIIRRHSWGEVSAEEWNRYLPLQKEQPETFVKMCAVRWKELQEENMPLRAVLNGRLVSVDDNIYDHFIIREILSEPEEFSEAKVIGRVLGKYQLGISDSWVHLRMEEMIAGGKLAVVAEAGKDEPVYRRRLKRMCDKRHVW